MSSTNLRSMADVLRSRSKTLINNDLKKILKEEGVACTGVKTVLQSRVNELITRAVNNDDYAALNRLQHRINHHGDAPPPPSNGAAFAPAHQTPPSASSAPVMTNGHSQMHGATFKQPTTARPHYLFKDSPFFEMRDLILRGITLEASPSHRQNCSHAITLNEQQCGRLRSDPTLRLFLFSYAEQPLTAYTRLDIAFPSQIEVRVNNDEVKANYKGLKNKPGSTRPVDITSLVRTTPPNYRNQMHITYALTQKASPTQKFHLCIYMVRKFSVDELSRRIRSGAVISKASVLDEMRKKANDPDIVVESSVMSLKDPVSTLRMSIPCRSTLCTHNRCFDAESFLQLQEQAPTWQCPICHKTISFQALAVDEYVQEILDRTAKDTDQVTIEPDGRWFSEKDRPATKANGHYGGDSDEDLVDITDIRLSAIKTEAMNTPQSLARTPPVPSREPSSAPKTGQKRTSDVIDLTLSDDDEPARPTKKVAYSTPSSLPDASRRYQLPQFSFENRSMRPQAPVQHSVSSGLRMDAPSQSPQYTYGDYRLQAPPTNSGQGSSQYPTFIDSSP